MTALNNENSSCFSLPVTDWNSGPDSEMQKLSVDALENGKVLFLPNLAFHLSADEKSYLRPDCVDAKTKSVKFSPLRKAMWGAAKQDNDSPVLAAMLARYAKSAESLVRALFPGYASALSIGNTSFRPVEAKGRVQSKRHDDSRLHVDAFPSRPAQGNRLLRVFTNVHPGEYPRAWRVGEPFADVARHFLPRIPKPLPGSAKLLNVLKITKGVRTPYDHYMLHLHDKMKLDSGYQANAPYTAVSFPPGSSWIVFTDQVSHAAMSGQHAFEQTFTLPVTAMANPATSPLKVLEGLKKVALV